MRNQLLGEQTAFFPRTSCFTLRCQPKGTKESEHFANVSTVRDISGPQPLTRLATSVRQRRPNHRKPDPTDLRVGCSHFSLSSGGARGTYY